MDRERYYQIAETPTEGGKGMWEFFRKMQFHSFLVNEKDLEKYINGDFVNPAYLNDACLAISFPEVYRGASSVFELEKELRSISKKTGAQTDNSRAQNIESELTNIVEEARKEAGDLIGAGPEHTIIFGRNCTELMHLLVATLDLKKGDEAVVTDAENHSMVRAIYEHRDHGNSQRQEPGMAYANYYTSMPEQEPLDIPARDTGTIVKTMSVLNQQLPNVLEELEGAITANTKLLLFSHVIRDNGSVLPAEELCQLARKIKTAKNPQHPEMFIVLDSAQAVGNLPKIDLDQMELTDGAPNALIYTPYKAMSGIPLGICCVKKTFVADHADRINHMPVNDQPILKHMIAPELDIKPNTKNALNAADISGLTFTKTKLEEYGLKGNDFSEIDKHRAELKNYLFDAIKKINAKQLEIELPALKNPSNFILNFRFQGYSGVELARYLSSQGIFVSYIIRDPGDRSVESFRVSFDPRTTKEDIDLLVKNLDQYLNDKNFLLEVMEKFGNKNYDIEH